MVELALNLFWLALAIAAFALEGSRSRRATIALIAIVALLFPVISVSDDLSGVLGAPEAAAVLVEVMLVAAFLIEIARIERRKAGHVASLVRLLTDPRSPPAL